MRTLTAILLFLALTVVPKNVHSAERTLTIAAASDLTFALNEIVRGFEKDTGIKTVLSFGSTGIFAMQIENGAPFDIFFAANEGYMNRLRENGLILPDSQQIYAQGRIVLAVNKKSGVKAKTPETLLDPKIKKIAIAHPDHAPYGIAAKEVFVKLGLWNKIKPKLVYGENIRQTLQFIQTGNAQAGIVALSVANVPEIEYLLIDSNLHNPIDQSVGILKAAKNEKEAKRFIEYMNSPNSRQIMKRYGFLLPGEF